MSRTATFISGPLHGQTIEGPSAGQWATYRDDAGNPIAPAEGDEEGKRLNPRKFYVHQGNGLYVHLTTLGVDQP